MNFPILVVPSDNGFQASLGAPFHVTVEAPTPAEVEAKAAEFVVDQLRKGGEIRWLSIPPVLTRPTQTRDALDEEVHQEWLECIEEYRRECDEAERRRIAEEDAEQARTAS